MATIDLYNQNFANTHQAESTAVTQPYVTRVKVDLADVVAKKGSNLEASDVINLFPVPAGSMVMYGGSVITESSEDDGVADITVGDGSKTYATVNVGSGTEGNISGNSLSAKVYNTQTMITATVGAVTSGSADAPVSGVFQFFVVTTDVSPKAAPGLVKLGS